jgi:hypothetical protein
MAIRLGEHRLELASFQLATLEPMLADILHRFLARSVG